jgi:hypothetical protein
MRIILPAMIVLALCGAASAGEQPATLDAGVQYAKGEGGVGHGIICDTSAQAGRFLALRNGGTGVEKAVDTVNREEKSPRACGAALVMFRMEEELSLASLQHIDGKPVSIVKIVVVAISADGENWSPIQPKVQFTVLPVKGQDV